MTCTTCTAVLSDEVYREIETVGAFCAKIADKKTTSDLIRQLNELYPLPNLGHLKRVKADGSEFYILLAAKSHTITSKWVLEANMDVIGLTDYLDVQVPKSKPITRAQYEAAKALWPTKFHENKRLERALNGTLFSKEEISLMEKFMAAAITECRCVKSKQVGAVIVDPQSGSIVARGSSCPSHPLKHAVMVCIDAVAMAQGGGAWSDSGRLSQRSSLADGATVQIDSGSLLDSGSVPPAKKHKPSQQYLCTGYDVYVTMEPCIMCAMALLHSRIRRVFYGCSNSLSGGLGTLFKIHVQPGLNHHFEVFRGFQNLSDSSVV